MPITELNNLVEIITRKIYHENILFYEEAAYNNDSWEDKEIALEDISLEKIASAIQNGEDLNCFGQVCGNQCIACDLNKYLKLVKKARTPRVTTWIEMLSSVNMNQSLLDFVKTFLDTHTEKENILMKRAFLKKINHPMFFSLEDREIDNLFYTAIMNLELEETYKLS